MLSQESELHLIKTSIFLKKVAITVRFPCSISFALKNEQNLVDHRSSYELVKGQCVINHGIEIELELPCFRGKYEEKKIGLLIYMVSANGKIPAGSVTINPVEKTVVDKKSYLQKCPDKNAYAVFTGSFERVKVLRSNNEKGRLSNLASSTVSGINQIRRSSFHQSSVALNKEEQTVKSPEQEPLSSPRELSLSNLKVVQSKQYEDDLTTSQGLRKMTFPALPKLRLDELGRRNTLGSIERDFQSKRSRVSSRNGDENDWQIQAQKSRIKTLEKQKTTYIKQISKLRSSMAKVDSQRRYQPDIQTNLDLHYNKDLQEQLQRLKEKTRSQQKKERQSTNMMHQLREELDKKKSKIFQLDSSRNKIENQLSEKDRIINQLQGQKRKLLETLDEEKAQSISFSKRFDLKENSFKEQIKKLTEKVSQIDSQRQKAVLDYNILLGQIQSSEKRHQLSLREREKVFSDEKLKLSKRNDQLNSQLSTLKEKLLDCDNSLRQYDSLKKNIEISQRQQDQAKKTLDQENEAVRNLLKASQQERQKLQEELLATEHQYSNQKNTLKKKVSEQNQQIFSLKQKYEKTQKSLNFSQSKLRQFQNKTQALQKQRKSLLEQLQGLRKKLQKKQYQQQSRQRMTQTLSVQNSSHNIKLSQLKSKLDTQKIKFDQMQAKYQQQVKYLIGTKELLQNQLEEMKWLMEKEKQKYFTLNALHRELGEQNTSLNHQIIHLQQRLVQIDQEKEEKSNQVSILQQKILNLEQVINQNISLLQSKMKISEDQYNRVCSQKQSMTEKFVAVESKIIQAQNYHQYLIQTCQGLEMHIKSRDEHITKLEDEVEVLKNQVDRLVSDVNFKNNQNLKLKQNVKALEKDITAHIISSQSLRHQSRQAQDKIILLQQSNKIIQSQLFDSKKDNSKVKLQLDDYRKKCTNVMQQLIDYFGRQKDIGDSLQTLHSFPDSKLSSLLIQNLMKIADKRKKVIQELEELRNATSYLENQLMKLQTYCQKIEEEHGQFVRKSQQQLNKVLEQKNTKIQTLQQKLRQFSQRADDNKNQLSFYNAQTDKYQNAITLLNQQIGHKQQTQNQLRLHITKLQNQLYEFKQKQIKQKLLYSTQADELKQILILQQERNEQLANSYRGELKQKQKWLHEKMEQLRKALLIQEQYRLFKLKKDQQIKDCQTLIEHQKQSKLLLERSLKEKQKIIQQNQAQISHHQDSIHQMTISISLEQQQKQKISQKYHTLQQQFRLFKNQLSNKTNNLQQSDKRQRQRRQKLQSQKQSIQNQNKELRQKNIRLESQNQFYRFYKEESTRKIEQLQKIKDENYQQLIKNKQASMRLQKELAAQAVKIYKFQMDYQNIGKQRDYINEQNSKLKEKINDLQDKTNQITNLLSEGDMKDRQLNRLSEKTKIMQQQYDKGLLEFKGIISKLKQDVAYKQNRIKQLENQIEFSSSDLNAEKQKWKTELQNEKNIYQLKLETIEDNIIVLQNELEFQREQAVKEIQGANGIIQELNEVIREKEEMIEYKEEVIGEQTVRLEQLHTQLNQCVGKWQKQKQVYLPTSSRLNQIRQQINRMNKFIGDLDGRNKQLLEISKRKLQQTFDHKPSLTEILKDLNVLLQKSKNRIINRCNSQKEKEGVITEFKGVQEKLDLVLRSTQIVIVKN